MAKVQKSLRIEEADAERVKALKTDKETEAAAYVKVIRAGLEALEAPEEPEPEEPEPEEPEPEEPEPEEPEPEEPAGTGDAERELVDVLKAQLAEKDAQIMRLQSTLDAQAAAIAAEAVSRMKRPRGLVQRVRALLVGDAGDGWKDAENGR